MPLPEWKLIPFLLPRDQRLGQMRATMHSRPCARSHAAARNPAPARSMAIFTLGHICYPRVPTILNHVWLEYRFEEPRLAIVAALGMIECGLGEEAGARAMGTERLWHTRDNRGDAQPSAELEPAEESLGRVFANVGQAESLPASPGALRMVLT